MLLLFQGIIRAMQVFLLHNTGQSTAKCDWTADMSPLLLFLEISFGRWLFEHSIFRSIIFRPQLAKGINHYFWHSYLPHSRLLILQTLLSLLLQVIFIRSRSEVQSTFVNCCSCCFRQEEQVPKSSCDSAN